MAPDLFVLSSPDPIPARTARGDGHWPGPPDALHALDAVGFVVQAFRIWRNESPGLLTVADPAIRMFVPLPTLIVSCPIPATIRLFPLPAVTLSLPLPSTTTLLPFPSWMVSLPLPSGHGVVAVAGRDGVVAALPSVTVLLPLPNCDVIVAVAGRDNGVDGQRAGQLDVVVAVLQEDIDGGPAIRGLGVDAVEPGLDVDTGAARVAAADRDDLDLVVGGGPRAANEQVGEGGV